MGKRDGAYSKKCWGIKSPLQGITSVRLHKFINAHKRALQAQDSGNNRNCPNEGDGTIIEDQNAIPFYSRTLGRQGALIRGSGTPICYFGREKGGSFKETQSLLYKPS